MNSSISERDYFLSRLNDLKNGWNGFLIIEKKNGFYLLEKEHRFRCFKIKSIHEGFDFHFKTKKSFELIDL